MNDLISREAAIDGIKKRFCTDCDNYKGIRCRACNFDDAMGVIEDMPSAQQWVPCSERLPDEDCEVLITVKEGYVVGASFFKKDNIFIPDEDAASNNAIAWLLFPEPYVEVGK